MEQHPIPQHIASFEFKLFGNLTVRQFITLAIPMSLATLVFFSSLPTLIRLPLSGIIAIFAFFAALVPVGGRPLDKWLVSFIRAISSPTQRIWTKESKIPQFLSIVIAPPQAAEEPSEPITSQGRERLRAYLRSLPKGEVTAYDVKEQIAIQRLNLSEGLPSETLVKEGKLPPPIIWPTAQSSLPIGASAQYSTIREESLPPKITTHAQPYALPGLEKRLARLSQAPIIKAKLASEANFTVENVIPIQTFDKQIKLIHGVGKTRTRKLHFAPPAGFDLAKLPIRGEKRFEISEELKKRFQFDQSLFDTQLVAPKAPKRQKTTRLEKQTRAIPKPKISLQTPRDVTLKIQETELLDSQISFRGQKSKNTPMPQVTAHIVPLTNKPNVISGIVTSANGTPMENIILVIHDSQGIPVRALKTNKLGQFLSVTQLASGTYTVEIESDLATFELLTLNLQDQVLAPLEIKAKQ